MLMYVNIVFFTVFSMFSLKLGTGNFCKVFLNNSYESTVMDNNVTCSLCSSVQPYAIFL